MATNNRIKEYIAKAIGIVILALLVGVSFFSTCIGDTDSSRDGANYYDTRLKYNKYNYDVVKQCLPNAEPNTEEAGIVKYIETFEDKGEALNTFRNVINKIGEVHAKEKIRPRYGNGNKLFFVCYGKEWSVIAEYSSLKVKGNFEFYSVVVEYVDTESYDWDYLSSQIEQ
jgi:hypothetical protein